MKIANKKKITNLLNFNLKLIALSSLLFSQLSLSEIFLYQNNPDISSINIAKADVSDTWYDSDWSYRKKITINHIKVPNADQTNFPVLVSVIDADLKTVANGGKVANDNGYDIIFATQDGILSLDHEIESYDAATGSIAMWVKVPVLSHTVDTMFYIYYGNSAIDSSQEDTSGVWDEGGANNFKGVWHMNEVGTGAVGDYNDSIANANDSTNIDNQPTMTASGQVGNAESFDGTNDYIDVGNGSGLDLTGTAMSFSLWIKVGSDGIYSPILDKFITDWDAFFNGWSLSVESANTIRLWLGFSGSASNFDSAGTVLVADGWKYVTYTYDGSVVNIYINSALDRSVAETRNVAGNLTQTLVFGHSTSGNNISLDEVRISSVSRSAYWIAAEYNNQSDPSSFLSLSSEEQTVHHLIVSGTAAQTAGDTQEITITAKNSMNSTFTAYTGNKTITLSGANIIGSNTPTFTDNTHEVNFGSSGTILFTNGVAHTDIKLYKAETAEIDVTDGTYSTTGNASYDLNVTVSPAAVNSFDISSPATVTSETPFSLTLTSKDSSGNTTTGVTNTTTLSINQGTINISSIPNTDFTTNGIYTNNITISNITQNSNIVMTVTNGSISNTQNLSVIGVSHGVGLFPQKPVIDPTAVAIGNLSDLPDDITQIAISRTSDFSNVSWQDFDKDKFSHLNENQETLYFKFRTSQGAVSDVVVYTPQPKTQTITSTLNDGDIVKTISSPDVYVIKIKNNKKFKRLILSPSVFNSYQHLKWENLKTVSQEQLDSLTTSNLVKETADTVSYALYPNGDTGERRIFTGTFDQDGVYEINAVDRDSYQLIG